MRFDRINKISRMTRLAAGRLLIATERYDVYYGTTQNAGLWLADSGRASAYEVDYERRRNSYVSDKTDGDRPVKEQVTKVIDLFICWPLTQIKWNLILPLMARDKQSRRRE